MKGIVQNVLLVACSCTLALATVEFGLRTFEPDDDTNTDPLHCFDPELGWANRPNAHATFNKPEFAYPVAINSLGMRDREIGPRTPGSVRLAVLGDSFVWGWGVADDERFTQILEGLAAGVQVLNFGVSGYGPVQYLLQLDRVLALQPDGVLLTLSLGSDLADNVVSLNGCKPSADLKPDGKLELITGHFPDRCRRDFEASRDGFRSRSLALIESAVHALFDRDGNERVEALNTLLHVADKDLTGAERREILRLLLVNERLLEALRSRVDAALGRGRFAILLAPSIYEFADNLDPAADPDGVRRRVLPQMERLGIPALDGRNVIDADDFWPADGHWRPSGHAKIARLVSRFAAKLTPIASFQSTVEAR